MKCKLIAQFHLPSRSPPTIEQWCSLTPGTGRFLLTILRRAAVFFRVTAAVLQVSQNVYVHFGTSDQTAGIQGIVARFCDRELIIRFPNLQRLPAEATPGSEAVLKVANACGVQCATCSILEASETPTAHVKLAAPQVFTMSQSRKFFRLQYCVKAVLTVKDSASPALVGKTDPSAMTQDISAGGVRLDSALAAEVGDHVVVAVRLPMRQAEDAVFSCSGTVRRVSHDSAKTKHPHQLCIEFTLGGHREEDALMATMFELQRRTRHA